MSATTRGESPAAGVLATALEAQRERLLPCVHCGFCLPACPTYNRLGDENDSPRGRLDLMSAVVDGRLAPDAEAFRTHIDRCLGCRACEPVCPSGVEYGALLELARHVSASHVPPPLPTRLLLSVFKGGWKQSLFFFGGRLLRGSGVARLGARLLPNVSVMGSAKLGLAMLASSAPWRGLRRTGLSSGAAAGAAGSQRAASNAAEAANEATTLRATASEAATANTPATPNAPARRVALLTGCVQDGLFERVNAATVRVLQANGFSVTQVRGQGCCGALHAHSGDLDQARDLAKANVQAFGPADAEFIVVNAAGCGAAMKEYGHLLGAEDAEDVSRRVRDVNELLASVDLRQGAAVECTVAVDHPCHLVHAQGIRQEPITVLEAVPGVTVAVVENADECCGGAGIYGITHPDLGSQIGGDKVAAVRSCGADVLSTPNPGCMMQIGAGLLIEGLATGVVHPVEILDESYRRAGFYDGGVA